MTSPSSASTLPPSAETAATAAPSTLSQDEEFTTQAALSLTRASQTSNFVSSKAYYDISFRTATAGAIKSVVMDFPAGTSVGSALVVEATGIGPGTLAASAGKVLTYTVTNAVNVPALKVLSSLRRIQTTVNFRRIKIMVIKLLVSCHQYQQHEPKFHQTYQYLVNEYGF